jgi:hypothetical protein
VACLSFEERCTAVPLLAHSIRAESRQILVRIDDPDDAFPNYREEIGELIKDNEKRLSEGGAKIDVLPAPLLATEDDILDIIGRVQAAATTGAVVLDITSFPKRYFCLMLKRMLRSSRFENILVTYTGAGEVGYTSDHLARDPLPCDHLPGFAGTSSLGTGILVCSLGFEALNIQSIVSTYPNSAGFKFIMSFPAPVDMVRRQWNMLRQILPEHEQPALSQNIRAVANWDAEQVYRVLKYWLQDRTDRELALAPFGIKTHSLGMALFAVENDISIYYTQPKSYNPRYTSGAGMRRAYVVKWEGVPAYARMPVGS